MIVGHGVDIVEVARIAESLGKHSDRFLERVFTDREVSDSGDGPRRVEHLAARFAAKEAALKAIGTGWSEGIGWTDVETRRGLRGKPELVVTGRALEIARELGGARWFVSLSHTDALAMASVILEGD